MYSNEPVRDRPMKLKTFSFVVFAVFMASTSTKAWVRRPIAPGPTVVAPGVRAPVARGPVVVAPRAPVVVAPVRRGPVVIVR